MITFHLPRLLRLLLNLVVGGERRRTAWLILRPPVGLLQPSGMTMFDRYPSIFTAVQSLLVNSSDIKLLSFGCSSGEEVHSLRGYFPTAFIRGTDIDARRVASCRQQQNACPSLTEFDVANSAANEPPQYYHAVFALAVLRHGDLKGAPSESTPIFRFDQFDAHVGWLTSCLRTGGYLVVRHCNFRVEDCSAANILETIAYRPRSSPVYGQDNLKLINPGPEAVIFRKLANVKCNGNL